MPLKTDFLLFDILRHDWRWFRHNLHPIGERGGITRYQFWKEICWLLFYKFSYHFILNRPSQHSSHMETLRLYRSLRRCCRLCSKIKVLISSLHSSRWQMVNARLCEKARVGSFFFLLSRRHFELLNCEAETSCPGNSAMTLRQHILEQATAVFLAPN